MNTCIYHAHIHTACCSRPPFPLMHQHLSTKQHTPPNGHRRSSMRPRLVPRTCGLHDLHRQTHTSTHTHTRTYTHRGNDVSNKHQGRSYTTAAVLWTRTKTKHTHAHTQTKYMRRCNNRNSGSSTAPGCLMRSISQFTGFV